MFYDWTLYEVQVVLSGLYNVIDEKAQITGSWLHIRKLRLLEIKKGNNYFCLVHTHTHGVINLAFGYLYDHQL